VICKKCYSEMLATFPADIRLYLNRSRTVSAAPLNPPPEIAVCLDCGFSEFVVSSRWLSAGWLRPFRETPAAMLRELARTSQHEEREMDQALHPVAQRAPEPIAQQSPDQSPDQSPAQSPDPNAQQQDGALKLVSGSGCRRSPSPRARWGLLR
jgi:hypothetical protein